MRVFQGLFGLVVALGLMAAPAGAQGPAPFMPHDPPGQRLTGAPPPGGVTSALGVRTDGQAGDQGVGSPADARRPSAVRPIRLTASCARRRGRSRCVVRDAATRRVVRRCDSRGSLRRLRSRCLALARRPGALGTRVAPIARASQLQSQGYPTQLTPAVGKIQGDAVCSGTVVAPTLVLTAAHCVWNRQTGTYHGNLTFGPGATWGGAAITYPYGRWQVHRPYVPLAYTQGDDSYDFALMEIAPSNGRYISEFVGAWDITPNIRWTPGTRVYMMGYPASGFWQTAAGFFGTGQYFCDASWKGDYFALGSGWEIYADCAMNGGASGGPWFVNVGGRWTIGGVNNKCYGPKMDDPKAYCTPYSYALRAAYFNDRIVTLWNDVQAQLTYR